MKNLLLSILFILCSCSRGTGIYKGVALDVSWEGYFVSSCEATVKTSAESSHQEFVSSTDHKLCDALQSTAGQPVTIYYKMVPWCPWTSTCSIIEDVKWN